MNTLVLSCEDILPTRDETPVQLFETSFQSNEGKTRITLTRDPINIHTPHPPPIIYQLQLINLTDETLQGLADSISGTFELWLDGEPSISREIMLSRNNEVPPIGVSSHIDSELLTLDPSDTFYVEIAWLHETEDFVKLWDFFGMQDGEQRTVKINALAKIRLFPGTPFIVTNIFRISATYIKLS